MYLELSLALCIINVANILQEHHLAQTPGVVCTSSHNALLVWRLIVHIPCLHLRGRASTRRGCGAGAISRKAPCNGVASRCRDLNGGAR